MERAKRAGVLLISYDNTIDSDQTIEVEGNQYFPPEAIRQPFFKPSENHSVCPWKGTASYYDIEVNGRRNANAVT